MNDMNWFIANVLEPYEGLPPIDPDRILPYPSPGGAWYAISFYEEGDIPVWVPLDFGTSGEGLKLMMERIVVENDTASGMWHRIQTIVQWQKMDLGRAVQEAFALANGWKECV